jgi:biopolymer transport protein ExbD
MQFARPPRKETRESVVPMINVVFLLLIFFLMSAVIAPPDPIEITLPESALGKDTVGDQVVYVGADGVLAMDDLRGDAVLAALSGDAPLELRADAGLEATVLAALLPKLGARGVHDIRLVTAPR